MNLNVSKHNYCKVIFSCLVMILFSCKKDDPGSKNNFTWVHHGTSHSTTVDTAYISRSGLQAFTIRAGEKRPGYTMYVRVEFNLTSFNEGIYWINDGSGQYNRLTYRDDAGELMIGAGGSFTISKNSNNYLSGNFSATLITGSGVTSLLTGHFTNMPVR